MPTCLHNSCVSWTLEGSPLYEGGSCAICTGQASQGNSVPLTVV